MRIKLGDMFKVIELLIVIVALCGCGADIKETPEDIVEEIYPYLDKLNEGKVTKMLMNGNGLLQGASEEWYFTILIEAVEYNGKA